MDNKDEDKDEDSLLQRLLALKDNDENYDDKMWLEAPKEDESSSDLPLVRKVNSDGIIDIIVKDELKQEEEILIYENRVNERNDSEGNESDEDEFKNEVPSRTKKDNDCDFEYKKVVVKCYKSSFAKENPEENVIPLFKENDLKNEKTFFHRKIFNDMFENVEKKKLEELQSKYVEYLRNAADLETFKCLKCDYKTIHKSNLKSHLLLIHKRDLQETWYKCLQCRYKVKNLASLQRHQTTHEESSSSSDEEAYNSDFYDLPLLDRPADELRSHWDCDFCPFDTDDKDAFEKHKITHKDPIDPKRYMCYRCDYGVVQKKSLQRHLVKNHQIELKGYQPSEDLKCPHCDYKTDLKSSYNIHMMQHKNPDEITWLTCKYCEFKTKHKASIRNHVLNHENPEKKFMCEVCSKRFRTKGELQGHSVVHKDISELSEVQKCPECSFQTKYKLGLKQHMELHREPEFICDICGFKSRRKYNHKMHMQRHKDERECEIYRCAVCPYYTKFKAHLKAHLNKGKHKPMDWKPRSDGMLANKSQGKSTICSICGLQLSSKSALITHSKLHKDPSEIQMYKCEKCNFESRYKASYDVHKKTHEPPELMACEVCGMKLKKKNYKMHLLTHQTVSEAELFTCALCSYQTKFRAYLREHLKKRHNIITAGRPGRKISNLMRYKEQPQDPITPHQLQQGTSMPIPN